MAARGAGVARLASPFDFLKDHYEVVVVGSGYGGSIAASRLARAGRQVCLLEQGKEFQPGEYPNTLLEATAELQVSLPEAQFHLGSRSGLYDLHAGQDINVFKGCGLGGTSLVNANVSIRPDPRVFQQYRWPRAIQAEASQPNSALWQSYDRAFEMLGANQYPTEPSDLDKLNALERSAAGMGAASSFHRTTINVTFDDRVSSGGVQQGPCKRCGDCVSGCNYWAKNTTLMNYLPDAFRHGAVIFTKCSVRYLERDGDHWAVWFQRLDSGQEPLDAEPGKLTADLVVLAGGSLGSTEILLRSKQRGLPLPNQVGVGFSGNGDVLGFGYDLAPEINAMGWGRVPPGRLPPVGPCITGVIDLRASNAALLDGIIVEEGSVPGAVATFMPVVMAAISRISSQSPPGQGSVPLPRPLDELESLALGPYHGALQHTQIYLAMAHDGADGVLTLSPSDQLEIRWPDIGQRPIFDTINQKIEAATDADGGVFVENPLWALDLLSKNLTTVHPLGGCRMADDTSAGVVNSDCQVFSGGTGEAVHENLYVMDGSVVPCPLGVNPLLTISALSERAVANLAAARGWVIDYASAPPLPAQTRVPGADFTERWRGTLASGADLTLELNVIARDLNALLNDAQYNAEVKGSAATSQGARTESFGVSGLLSTAPGQVLYQLELRSAAGSHSLSGRRGLPGQQQANLFGLTAWLAVESEGDPAMAGTLHCHPADLLNELGSLRIYNVDDENQRLTEAYSLGRRLLGPLSDVYSNVAARPSALAPGEPPLKRRTLLAPAPEADYFQASDGRLLRLLRYPAGGRPILLVHGLGQSSRIFSAGSLQPNLVEFLSGFGLDVWLLDDRGSIDLPGALESFNLDQIAAIDLPVAIERVARATGTDSLALLAHGWGAAACWMHMLSGQADRVATFVSSQVGPFVDVPAGVALRARLRTDSVWQALGARALGGYDAEPGLAARLWNALSYRNGTRSAVTRRIEAIYGDVLVEASLSERARAALGYLYGPVSVAAGEHVQAIARAGHLVDAAGSDRYLSAGALPDIPVLLLHGSANGLSLSSGIDKSLHWLRSQRAAGRFTEIRVDGYGQDDSIVGHLAPVQVFPSIAGFLEGFRRG